MIPKQTLSLLSIIFSLTQLVSISQNAAKALIKVINEVKIITKFVEISMKQRFVFFNPKIIVEIADNTIIPILNT